LVGASKYNPNANPSVLNSFATAAFRFGHSMINSLFKVIFTNQEIFWRLSDLFNGKKFNGKHMLDIEPMILGLLNQKAQKVDGSFANELKNHLFTEHSPKQQTHFGGDLVARNIQRGRDHGIPDYNTFRKICSLQPITSFNQKPIEMSREMWRRFQSLYKRVDDIDLYPAAIAENPVDSDALLGPTFSCLIGLQFHNLKYGDRFFFTHRNTNLNYLKKSMLEMEERTLSDVICDNTYIEKVQEKALETPNPVTNPIKACRIRNAPSQTSLADITNIKIKEPHQNPELQRVPKSLDSPDALFDPSSPLRAIQDPTVNTFQTPSIFEAFRKLQNRNFQRSSNKSGSKPIKFLERFDQADAIILNP